MSDAPDLAPPRTLVNRQGQSGPRSQSMMPRSSDGGGTVSYGLDDNLIVEFYPDQIYMEHLSNVTGHPIFQERIFTKIIIPGDSKKVVVHQTKGISYETVQDADSGEYHTNWELMAQQENGDPIEPEKYPNAWNRFMKKGTRAHNGYPIEEWGTVTRSYAASLKAQNIHTVEALAALSDTQAQNVMGGIKYRDLARAYLDQAERDRIVATEQERARSFQEQLSVQTEQLKNLQGEILRLQNERLQFQDQGLAPGHTDRREIGAQLKARNASQEVKKMSRKEAESKHNIPTGRPGEAA